VLACSHPSLAPDAQVALTLRCVAGMSPAAIARAFLVPERTLQQRLVRAKRKVRDSGLRLRPPIENELRERIDSALAVTYLIFNEGYASTAGEDLMRVDLTAEALFLGQRMLRLLPEDPDVLALNALMLLIDSRRDARLSTESDLIPLEDQDRSLWDQEKIFEGVRLLDTALSLGRPGRFHLEAAIAAAHATIVPEQEKWLQVAALYGELIRVHPSPLYELNRSVAVAMVYGPEAGLEIVRQLEGDAALRGYQWLPATKADMKRRAGLYEDAAVDYEKALTLATNPVERCYLQRRLNQVRSAKG
jgi:RNA polymerase sigma-70 factor (ECF subfamily)